MKVQHSGLATWISRRLGESDVLDNSHTRTHRAHKLVFLVQRAHVPRVLVVLDDVVVVFPPGDTWDRTLQYSSSCG